MSFLTKGIIYVLYSSTSNRYSPWFCDCYYSFSRYKAMNEYGVFITFNGDEVFLGTVREILDSISTDFSAGNGISVSAIFSDLVSAIAFDDGPREFTIELREPGAY